LVLEGKQRVSGKRQSGFAPSDGARLYYEISGSGEPLVLVHAGIADSRMWDGQLAAFARRYQVIRYDMRGFGRSAMVEGPFSHHEDLRALLDSLGIERAFLVGCSIGGRAIIDFALEHPERVRALVPVGSALGGFDAGDDPPEQWEELVAAENAGDLGRVSALEVRIWVDGPYRGPDGVDSGVRDLVAEMNLIALKNEASGLGDERPLEPPAVNRLAEIQVPTLVIVGDLDRPEIIEAADLLERRIPRARRAVIPGTAHLPNMERPRGFNRVVLEFLEGLGV
jgi:pimeloyl-ACP methyl ester carboxylesterase